MGRSMEENARRDSFLQLDRIGSRLGGLLSSRGSLELLSFWARNPNAWCSLGAVTPHTLLPRHEIDSALSQLVDAGLIEIREDNGMSLYALASSHAARPAVLKLARLTPAERRHLLRSASLESGAHWSQ